VFPADKEEVVKVVGAVAERVKINYQKIAVWFGIKG